MYRNDEEITQEVVFTRLLRAMDCYSDNDVFDMVEDTKYECEELEYPENSSADYIRYCEVDNIIGKVLGIEDTQFRYVEEFTVFDKEIAKTIDTSTHPIFEDRAICICNQYDLCSVTGHMRYGEDTEIWMTDKYDFYSVASFYIETAEVLKVHRRILSSASEDRIIRTSISNLLYGLQEAQYQKYDS